MTSKTLVQRSERVLRFLLGMRHPEVARHLERHGFGEADYKEGWDLLRAAAGRRFALRDRDGGHDPSFVDAVDAWENRWYPVISAALKRRHPEVHGELFHNLPQTAGPKVIVTVSTLLSRIEALEPAVRQTLQVRGLTDEVLAEVHALLAEGASLKPAPAADAEAARAEVEGAEQAIWAWYLEWSVIARAVIKSGRVLQRLGFNAGGRPRLAREPRASPTRTPAEAPDPHPLREDDVDPLGTSLG